MRGMRSVVAVADRRLSYRAAGEGEPLLLLHAFPLSADLWTPQLEAPPPGWRVIAPDFRGLGASTGSGARHVDAHVDDVLALMDALHCDRVVLGGLSMGGYVAFALARRAPERIRALVLADTRAEADTDEAREARVRMQQTVRDGGAKAIAEVWVPRLMGPTTFQSKPEVVDAIRSIIEQTPSSSIDDALETLKTRPDSLALLPFLTVPTLILVGEDDVLTPVAMAETMRQRMPRASLVVIPRAGHLSNIEQPEAFNAALERFLGGIRD
jgi:pimeloyl-ACP methyl ester carboxylesterase